MYKHSPMKYWKYLVHFFEHIFYFLNDLLHVIIINSHGRFTKPGCPYSLFNQVSTGKLLILLFTQWQFFFKSTHEKAIVHIVPDNFDQVYPAVAILIKCIHKKTNIVTMYQYFIMIERIQTVFFSYFLVSDRFS